MEPSPAQRFRDILADLGRIPDPAERAVQAHELQEAAKASASHLRAVLGGSVAELRNRMSLAQIAEMLGVSVQRTSQIATGKHGTARHRPSLIYAFRVLGNQLGGWHGEPGALPEGGYQSGRIDFNPGPNPTPSEAERVVAGPDRAGRRIERRGVARALRIDADPDRRTGVMDRDRFADRYDELVDR